MTGLELQDDFDRPAAVFGSSNFSVPAQILNDQLLVTRTITILIVLIRDRNRHHRIIFIQK